jgi:hypothetical protein
VKITKEIEEREWKEAGEHESMQIWREKQSNSRAGVENSSFATSPASSQDLEDGEIDGGRTMIQIRMTTSQQTGFQNLLILKSRLSAEW